MNRPTLKILNRSKNPLPSYQTEGAAGMDLHVNLSEDITIQPLERVLVPTGLFLEIPVGYEGQVRPRSGMSIKHGITLINAVGTIDCDYRGELKIPLVNISNEPYTLKDGERVAQLVIAKYERVNCVEVSELSDTDRGEGGFGSTGK